MLLCTSRLFHSVIVRTNDSGVKFSGQHVKNHTFYYAHFFGLINVRIKRKCILSFIFKRIIKLQRNISCSFSFRCLVYEIFQLDDTRVMFPRHTMHDEFSDEATVYTVYPCYYQTNLPFRSIVCNFAVLQYQIPGFFRNFISLTHQSYL